MLLFIIGLLCINPTYSSDDVYDLSFVTLRNLNEILDNTLLKDGSPVPMFPNPQFDHLKDFETMEMNLYPDKKYKCLIPRHNDEDDNDDFEYRGPSALELLDDMFFGETCIYQIHSYWIYQLCNGKHFRQYHEEKSEKMVQEYYLGKLDEFWQTEQFPPSDVSGLEESPPQISIAGKSMPHVPVLMTGGTPCDIGDLSPRQVRVYYVCFDDNPRLEIHSIRETSSCKYEAIVSAPQLCSHPSFKPNVNEDTEIFCVPTSDDDIPQISSPKSYKVMLGDHVITEPFPSAKTKPIQTEKNLTPVKITTTKDPKVTQKVIEDEGAKIVSTATIAWQLRNFLEGTECLTGGKGWWHHEFCYGKALYHVHYEIKNKVKKVHQRITLGQWFPELHVRWAKDHEKDMIAARKASKPTLLLYYTNGDLCHEIKQRRSTIVKLKCLAGSKGTAIAVSLTEPKMCEYVLVLESAIFCDLFNNLDDAGVPRLSARTQDPN